MNTIPDNVSLDPGLLPSHERDCITVQISEHDKEMIREFKRTLYRELDSYYQETNATVIAVYKAIVDHNIADENTLKSAQDCLNEWNQSPRKYPPFSQFKNVFRNWDISGGVETRNLWNRWTSGSFAEILNKLEKTIDEKIELWDKITRDTANKLSESMPTLPSRFLVECVNGETDHFTFSVPN